MMIGKLLSERYRLEERIATGGMGTVYVALDERLGRRVAVKLLKEELSDDPRFIERFRREARSAAALSHPNIASVYDYGSDGDCHFIVMELFEGNDLGRVIREEGPLGIERTAFIASQVADALTHAHAAGVVHRDIKPANVLVGPEDRVKVTDFGIARAVGDSTLTATGVMLGTAHYISPEQASGETVGPASDVYSLGIVTFEMLTGTVPFTGDSAVAVAMRHISDPMPAPSSVAPKVGAEFDDTVARATAKAPSDRFATAGELGAALISLLPTKPGRTAMAPVGAGTTAVLDSPTTANTSTVWPIPGDRWDPGKLGRRVIATFIALALIAAGLLVWRLSTKEVGGRKGAGATKAAAAASDNETPTPEASPEPTLPTIPETFAIPETLVGQYYEDVQMSLEAAGFNVEIYPWDTEEADAGTVLNTDPEIGSEVSPGDTITLIVSTGKKPHGHDKHEDDEHGD